jgi:hypothetical protein
VAGTFRFLFKRIKMLKVRNRKKQFRIYNTLLNSFAMQRKVQQNSHPPGFDAMCL